MISLCVYICEIRQLTKRLTKCGKKNKRFEMYANKSAMMVICCVQRVNLFKKEERYHFRFTALTQLLFAIAIDV